MNENEDRFLTYVQALYDDACPERDRPEVELGSYEENLFPAFYNNSDFGSMLIGDDVNLRWPRDAGERYGQPSHNTAVRIKWNGYREDWSRAGKFVFLFPYDEAIDDYQELMIRGGLGNGGVVKHRLFLSRYAERRYEGHGGHQEDMNRARWEFVFKQIEKFADQLGTSL